MLFGVRQSTTNLLEGERQVKPERSTTSNYYEAHGYPTDSRSHKDNRSEGEVHAYDDESTMHISEPINPPFGTKYCDNCGLNNHDCSECRKPYASVQRNSSNNDMVCFQSIHVIETTEINAQ